MGIIIKSPAEIAIMREAGRIVAEVLALLKNSIKPGVTTAELDALAEAHCRKRGAIPSFKNYDGRGYDSKSGRSFPASLCASINEEVVHGIPSRKRKLREGDTISLDFGAIYRGYQGDAAITVGVGTISAEAARLISVAEKALYAGIDQAREGKRLSDISWAIQSLVESNGFSVVRQYVGHGIGQQMHEEPQIPNFGPPGRGPRLQAGMVLAIEPMVNVGTFLTRQKADNWTVVTEDGSLSAHFEHTIAVTSAEPVILTQL